jgi:hypothetical protein
MKKNFIGAAELLIDSHAACFGQAFFMLAMRHHMLAGNSAIEPSKLTPASTALTRSRLLCSFLRANSAFYLYFISSDVHIPVIVWLAEE